MQSLWTCFKLFPKVLSNSLTSAYVSRWTQISQSKQVLYMSYLYIGTQNLHYSVRHPLVKLLFSLIFAIFLAEWWSTYGGGCPNLSRLAIRILSQTSSVMFCKRNQIPFEQIINTRNWIERQHLTDLVFVHYNLRLRQMWA
jgi:hypothetical protein